GPRDLVLHGAHGRPEGGALGPRQRRRPRRPAPRLREGPRPPPGPPGTDRAALPQAVLQRGLRPPGRLHVAGDERTRPLPALTGVPRGSRGLRGEARRGLHPVRQRLLSRPRHSSQERFPWTSRSPRTPSASSTPPPVSRTGSSPS